MDIPDQPADDYIELDYLLGRAFYLVIDLIELVTGAFTRLGAAPMGAALRRLEALQAALDCPLREARRWVRRQARLRAAPSAPARSPLSPHKIPGALPSLNPHAPDLLKELNGAASEVFASQAIANTS